MEPGLEPIMSDGMTVGEQLGLEAFAIGPSSSTLGKDRLKQEKKRAGNSGSDFYPIKPPSIPLAVRSPCE